jgi:hypothetical protein
MAKSTKTKATTTTDKPDKRASTIYWPADLLKAAKILGIEQDRELSEIVCTAVAEYLAKHRK